MDGDLSVRYRKLLDYLQRQGGAKVSEIARDLFMSESSVRRALTQLEGGGYLSRYHGGAALSDSEARSSIRQRRVSNLAEKDTIGRKAASLVEDGMTLLLMGGTTVQAICPYLVGKRLTVITNSLPVVNALAWEEHIQIILLSGVLNPTEMEVRGELTPLSLERLRADLMMTGTTGLHPIHGVMTDDPNGVETYTTCMRISDRVLVLADHTKCERYVGTTVLCALSDITALITDDGLPDPVREYYEKSVPKLYIGQR